MDQNQIDFSKLYDSHGEYVSRRVHGSFEAQQIAMEVQRFKLPNLLRCLPSEYSPNSVLEIGCATGELIGSFPISPGGKKYGSDISAENIQAAAKRYGDVEFFHSESSVVAPKGVDCVILSDILEHVDDDSELLRYASRLARKGILINLPLEDNWTNRNRAYGPNDSSGHLRKYTLQQGLALLRKSPGKLQDWYQVWVHEHPIHSERRELRRHLTGYSYGGNLPVRTAKGVVEFLAANIPAFGRRLHPSNLFAYIDCSER